MKELFDHLEKNERKILILLCVILAAALLFHQSFAHGQKKTYNHSVESLITQQKEYAKMKELNQEIKGEWLLWDEAKRDVSDIEKNYLYKENEEINQLRLDLRKIFEAARTRVVSDLLFDYADWEEEKLKRIRVRFTIAGYYTGLKRFIHQVEIHPKFLMIEKIDFRDIDAQTGWIKLQIELAGYYEY